ncbi:flagellar biosynthesis protein FlhA [Desulfurispira natronophila]|uniref:Flagellar biosynthesis protein FlhA n=1 Tax=Desulfurispira natronophila TaxID=682562 RepID=A0A7W8DGE7_9BACT|nr:flagellar biosynthesis protein FlhA [Desulfurispira natronophila]MBB5021421.1 flagellar biosynthesis protein FlhA [Desulfurispira natronophila]
MAQKAPGLSAGKILSVTTSPDVFAAFGILSIIAIMVLPVPAPLLDILLTVSITLGVLVILIALYIKEPLDFSIFPSVLLIVTLFRLSLNVATTRTILLHGHEGESSAGHVIQAFGQFVVGGNYVVGIIVFVILVIINFKVITNGASRVAEVAARFTLDAMPGKQMAIDADLNAGFIDESQARERRERIRREADFHGSMDGASKFVKGDAVAGIIITIINIVGGLIIGMAQSGLTFNQAVEVYTILTIGDGLVSQIPALIVSTAVGIVVTRAASESNLGQDIANQLVVSPKVIWVASIILFIFGIIPGMPILPFLSLSAFLAAMAFLIQSGRVRKIIEEGLGADAAEAEEAEEEEAPKTHEEEVEELLQMDSLELEVGYGVIPLVDTSQGGDLLERIKSLRKNTALDLGFIVPPIRIRDNLQLRPNDYVFKVKGIEVGSGDVYPGQHLAMNPSGDEITLPGTPTVEPAFGLKAMWVTEEYTDEAEMLGYTVVDAGTVISTHIGELIKQQAPDILGKQETQNLLENIKKTHPSVVEDLVPNQLPLSVLQRVLQGLLAERISIRNMLTILEALGDYAPSTKDPDVLTDYVRNRLSRQISKMYADENNTIRVLTLDPQLEQMISESIQKSDQGRVIVMEPHKAQRFLVNLIHTADQVSEQGLQPLLMVSPAVRAALKRLVSRYAPKLAIIAHTELADNVNIEALSTIGLEEKKE